MTYYKEESVDLIICKKGSAMDSGLSGLVPWGHTRYRWADLRRVPEKAGLGDDGFCMHIFFFFLSSSAKQLVERERERERKRKREREGRRSIVL